MREKPWLRGHLLTSTRVEKTGSVVEIYFEPGKPSPPPHGGIFDGADSLHDDTVDCPVPSPYMSGIFAICLMISSCLSLI